MGRKICLAFLCVLVMGMAAGVRAQENLDTLWTRTVGGTGNEVFYAMTRANNGNVLVCAYLDGYLDWQPWRYVIELSPNGELLNIIPVSPDITLNSLSGFRETPEGEFEFTYGAHIRRMNRIGDATLIFLIPLDYHHESWSFPHGYSDRGRQIFSNSYYSGTRYFTTGREYSTGYIPNYGIHHSEWTFACLYDYSDSSTSRYTGNSSTRFLNEACQVSWASGVSGSELQVNLYLDCTASERSWTTYLPANVGTIKCYADNNELPWLTSLQAGNQRGSFFAIHINPDDTGLIVTTRSDANAPASVACEVDSLNNLVAFGYQSATPPFRGMRFDVVGAESGSIGESVVVSALPSVEPKAFLLLEDNTAFTVSTVLNGTTRDLVIARTDTIPSGYYAPQPASVELLVEGPPAWGYRIHSGSYSQNQIVFQNLCGEARGNVSGNASSRWESGLANFTVFFTADHAIPTNSASDTIWLTAPECESVDIAWSMNGIDGSVKGPFHPEVSLQTFSCQLEPFGVNARFDIAGTTNMDSLQVWRKNATGMDSLLIATKYAVAGHHVVGDHNVPVGMTWTYYLLAADRLRRLWSLPNASASIFADPTVIVPDDYQLALPYPNPFNASTTFTFDVPELAIVHLDIYDITGRLVTTLMDQSAPAGSYTKTFDASEFASGVYLYSFRANDFQKHGKILLLK